MKLNEIRTFVAVAEHRSVQEAANRLHLTQSAVSRLIQRLEGELGVALFDRQTKPLLLTRDGEVALAHARRVLKASTEMADAFADAGRPTGTLRLGSSHVLARLTAGEPLDRLRSTFPGLTLRLHTDWSVNLMAEVASGALDGALTLLPANGTPPKDLASHRLALEQVHIVGTPELAARTPRTMAAMNEVGWVVQPDGCGYRHALTQALARDGAALNVAVEAFDQELLLSLAARGVGFGVGPLRLLCPPLAGKLVPIDVDGFRLTIAIWLVRGRHSGRLDAVFDALEDCFNSELAPYHSAAE